mgnify:CR=1 FL=1
MLTESQYESMRASGRITFNWGGKVKIWGGWYRHIGVLVDGVEVGSMQEKRRNKRLEYLSSYQNACVAGHDARWIVNQAMIGAEYK